MLSSVSAPSLKALSSSARTSTSRVCSSSAGQQRRTTSAPRNADFLTSSSDPVSTNLGVRNQVQENFIESPHLVHLSIVLDARLVDVKECWTVVKAIVGPLASREVEQQPGLATSWWPHQHTLDWLRICHISLTRKT